MKRYDVLISAKAEAGLRASIGFIGDVVRAQVWLDQMMEAIDSLDTLPRRAAPLNLARFPEDQRRRLEALPYEVRQKVVGDHYIRFVVDDDKDRVLVLQVWPARSMDHPDTSLPADLSEFDSEE